MHTDIDMEDIKLEDKTKIIAVAGKGGVGKTSLAGVIVKLLVESFPDKKILAIDADPAVGLSTVLNVDVDKTIDDIRKEVIKNVEDGDTKSAVELLGEAKYEIYDALKEQKVYINKKMDEQYPLMARGIYEGEEVQMIVMMWGLSWEKMTLGQANFLTVVSYLIQNAVLRAQRYMQALEEKRYSQNSRILEPEAFKSLVQAYMKAKLKNLVECVLIKVDVQNSEYQKTDEQMSGYMRDSDYMGMLPDGNLYVLLTNTTREGAVIVQDRFEKNGYKTEYVEMMSVCHRE